MTILNTFWDKDTLNLLQVSTILSAQKVGHEVNLFSYTKIKNAPNGTVLRDARDIMPEPELLKHRGINPALGTNRFRYLLQAYGHGIWSDLDVLFLKKIEFDDDEEVFGWQDCEIINGAILYLPKSSPILNELISFTNDHHPIPEFFTDEQIRRLRERRRAGNPVHVSQMRWGVWGPRALTYFIKKLNMTHKARSRDVFYPIGTEHRYTIFKKDFDIDSYISNETTAIHMWNALLRTPSRLTPHFNENIINLERGSFFYNYCTTELNIRFKS